MSPGEEDELCASYGSGDRTAGTADDSDTVACGDTTGVAGATVNGCADTDTQAIPTAAAADESATATGTGI